MAQLRPVDACRPARSRRRVRLLDVHVCELVADAAVRPRVGRSVPRARADRDRRPHAGIRLRARARQRARGHRRSPDRLPGRDRQRLRDLARVRQPLLAGPLSRRRERWIRHHQFGEGGYEQAEHVIEQLLGEAGGRDLPRDVVDVDAEGVEVAADLEHLASPETYLGSARGERFVPERTPGQPSPQPVGARRRVDDPAGRGLPRRGRGTIAYRFRARDVNLVLRSTRGETPFRVLIDGGRRAVQRSRLRSGGNGAVSEPRLYQLIRQRDPSGEHTFEITFAAPGVGAYVFTFG